MGLLILSFLHRLNSDSGLVRLLGFVVFAGIWGVVPYCGFLLVLWKFLKPSNEKAFRLIVVVAPTLIAVCFGLIMGLIALLNGDRDPGPGMFYSGGFALVVGYAYALLIELTLVVAKALKRVV